MQLRVLSTIGKESALTVSDAVFGVKANPILISQAIRVYLSNQRQGTSKTKTRSEVARTKKKWFKQKGTGNARHGARTPSLFVGGGVAHGPNGEQNFLKKMPTQMRKSALISVLSAQVKNIVVSDDIAQLDGKTASADRMFAKMLPGAEHVLIVVDVVTPMMMRSLSNLARIYVTTAERLTTYEVALADAVILTKKAVEKLELRLGKDEVKAEKPVKAVAKAVKAEKAEKVVPVEKAKKAEKVEKAEKVPATKTVKKVAKKTVKKAEK